jgi:hypothetical protein
MPCPAPAGEAEQAGDHEQGSAWFGDDANEKVPGICGRTRLRKLIVPDNATETEFLIRCANPKATSHGREDVDVSETKQCLEVPDSETSIIHE